jgi:methionyl-tRNA formyltransferase
LLPQAVAGLASGTLRPRAQATEGVTYAHKIQKGEARIDWSKRASEIDRQVRAFNAWPVAETLLDGEQLRIWEAEPLAALAQAAPGTILNADQAGVEVATGEGTLRLTRVQAAGRKAISAAEFARARPLVGKICS